MNYFPFHIGDYAVHTRHLTLMEDLAYRRLLDLYYTRERPLPNDEQEVARLIGMREHVAEVKGVLNEFFDNTGDGWFQTRCDTEIATMRAKQDNARASVAKRQAKASETQAPRERDASVIEASSTNTNTNTIKEREARATRLPTPFVLDEAWEAWARSERPDLDLVKTAANFADHWHAKPGKDGRKLDWLATWRQWVRNERMKPADVARVTAPPPKPSTYLADMAAHRAAVEAERIARKAREAA